MKVGDRIIVTDKSIFICGQKGYIGNEVSNFYKDLIYIKLDNPCGLGSVLLNHTQFKIYRRKRKDITSLEWILGYLSLAIPAAMLARLIRFLSGKKGTFFERKLMQYYHKMERKLLS